MVEKVVKDKEKVDLMFEIAEDIGEFFEFKRVQALGVVIPHDQIRFDKLMLFGWINEAMNGRGN